jgi:hypothetical protein
MFTLMYFLGKTENNTRYSLGVLLKHSVVKGVGGGAVGWETALQVAGSILDGVIGIFHWHNSSGRTMALGLTQSLTEMSKR